jgi:hypothetical protein
MHKGQGTRCNILSIKNMAMSKEATQTLAPARFIPLLRRLNASILTPLILFIHKGIILVRYKFSPTQKLFLDTAKIKSRSMAGRIRLDRKLDLLN